MTSDLLTTLEGDLVVTLDEARALVQRAHARIARREDAIRRATALTEAERLFVKSLVGMFPELDQIGPDQADAPGAAHAPDVDTVDKDAQQDPSTGDADEHDQLPTEQAGDADGAEESLRGREAVLRVLNESSDEWMSVRAVTDRMVQKGWAADSDDPAGSVRTTLGRIYKKDGVLERTHLDGRTIAYRLKPATNGDLSAR